MKLKLASLLLLATSLAIPAAAATNTAATHDVYGISGDYLASRSAGRLQDIAAAADFTERALAKDKSNPGLIERLFQYQLALGNIDKAEELAKQVIPANSQQRMARTVLGLKEMRNRHYGEARDQFAEAAYTPVGELTSGLLRAWAWAGEGELNPALRELSKLDNQDAFANYQALNEALILDFLHSSMRAEVAYKKAYGLAGSSLRVVQAYGNFLARANRKADAIKVYENFLAGGQANALVEADLADVSAGKVPQPLIGSAAAGAGEVLFSLAAALNTDQNSDTALLYCQLALTMAADKSLSLSLLGDIEAGSKAWDLSSQAYDKIPTTSPLRAYADTQIALNLSRIGKNDEAVEKLKAVVAADPKNADAWTTLGGIYRSDDKFAEAADAYSSSINLAGPNMEQDWRLYYYRGIAYDRMKNYEKSDADFRKALQISKDEPQALNYLGYSLIDRHVNTDEAIAMVKRAVELKPNDGYIIDSLAWAYYNLGDYEQALVNQEQAVQLTPSDAIIAEHLGDIYWRVGRKLEAGFQWQHAIDNHPEPADLARIQDKLKNGLPDLPVVTPTENKSTTQPSNG